MGTKTPTNWHKLEDDFRHKRSVVLFLGTGVDLGAPKGKDYSWDALLNHLLTYAVKQIIPFEDKSGVSEGLKKTAISLLKENEFSEPTTSFVDMKKLKQQITLDSRFPRDVKSTIIKQTLGNEKYVKLIQDFLYGEMEKDDIEKEGEKYVRFLNKEIGSKDVKFFTLFSVADFIMHNRNIRAVVTQNYDCFLCEAIAYLRDNNDYREYVSKAFKTGIRDIHPNTICDWKGQTDFTYDDINIYHVHGFIPRYEDVQAPKGNKIVLSLDDFYEDSRNVYSWQIASQLHFLSQYTCIFCGLSLEDYTNQRLLHYVKGKHHGNLYYINATDSTDYDKRIMDKILNNFHEKNGLTVLFGENGFKSIYKQLGEIKYGKQ